jgi:purine-nucleoside phosphorylase
MNQTLTLPQIDETAGAVRARLKVAPRIALILGSGLGALVDEIENPTFIPYNDLPHWPVSTVFGHSGRLAAGRLAGQDALVMQGRSHYYEGYTMAEATLPVRVFQRLGIGILIITNAAGALNPEFVPGDLMLITDHINLPGMSGQNPLTGPNLDELGPRFPDMTQAYDRSLGALARQAAAQAGAVWREGVYAGLSGPNFETPAELRFLRAIGCDAVGMSTVSEVVVARHGGTPVLGISGISNKANLDGSNPTSHQEVLEAGKVMVPKLAAVIRGVLSLI